jgi:hypothetical protein
MTHSGEPLTRIPDGMFGVYILWTPPQYRSPEAQAFLAPVNGLLEFYVGCGQRDRPFQHFKGTKEANRNKHKKSIIRKVQRDDVAPHVTVAFLTADRKRARFAEVFLIAVIGRRDLGTGPLTNKRAGGEGGFIGPETKARMSVSAKRRSNTKEGRDRLRKATEASLTPEARARNADPSKRQRAADALLRPEVRRKMSLFQKSRWQNEDNRVVIDKFLKAAQSPESRRKRAASLRRVKPEVAQLIRERIGKGETQVSLAKEYGIGVRTVFSITHRQHGY